MDEHPELLWWRKCPTCGFSELDIELIHPKNREAALKHPLAKRFPSQEIVLPLQANKLSEE
jgi:hypothetical protein